MKTEKINVQKICLIAFAICINFVGGQIALFLKLPIYLDSIGTVFIASILGPFYGMLPNLISGLLMGMTVDVYSLYYAPVGISLLGTRYNQRIFLVVEQHGRYYPCESFSFHEI